MASAARWQRRQSRAAPPDTGRAADDPSFDLLLRELARTSDPELSAGELPVGALLAGDRFRILKRIGAGGMGVVYAAFDAEREAVVALKTLLRVDGSSVYRLKQEFRSIASVSHANLVTLHELFKHEDHWFFSMEYIQGQPFDTWVRPAGQLSLARLRVGMAQLAAGMRALHDAGKVHRDLKPSNVLVTSDDELFILDFGLIAEAVAGGVGQTLPEEWAGTPDYMAPECCDGCADAASDGYAIGVMLFEALTGVRPFSGHPLKVLGEKRCFDPCPPTALFPELPKDLNDVCCALLSRDPRHRPSTAALTDLFPLQRASAVAPPTRPPPCHGPLVGREPELSVLRSAYEASLASEPRVVLVTGDSGIGKTALVDHFVRDLRQRSACVALSSRCYERECLPYNAFDPLIDGLVRYLRSLPEDMAAALLPRDACALTRLFPVLGRVRAVTAAASRPSAATTVRTRAFAALRELLARLRDRQPLVLWLDDVQWMDSDSAHLLQALMAGEEPVPVVLVLSFRGGTAVQNPSLRELLTTFGAMRPHAQEIRVGPLGVEAARALACRWLPNLDAEGALALAKSSGGVPFFLAELTRAGQVEGAATLSLEAALWDHALQLEPRTRKLLHVVAVAGRPLEASVALEASGAGADAIDALCRERLVGWKALDARTLHCYHDKIRETVVSSLSADERRRTHAALARACELHQADPEQIGFHLEGGGESERAARFLMDAAARAAHKLAFARAAELFHRTVQLGQHDAADRRALLRQEGDAWSRAGAVVHAADAWLMAAEGAPLRQATELRLRAAERLIFGGHFERGEALMDELLAGLALPELPRSPRAILGSMLSQRFKLTARGLRFAPRPEHALPATELLRVDASHAAAFALTQLAWSRSLGYSARTLTMALRLGEPLRVAKGLAIEACYRSRAGGRMAPAADAILSRADALLRGCKPDQDATFLGPAECGVATFTGRFARAIEAGRRSLALFERLGMDDAPECTVVRLYMGIDYAFVGAPRIAEEAVRGRASGAALRGDRFSAGACAMLRANALADAGLVRESRAELSAAREAWKAARLDHGAISLFLTQLEVRLLIAEQNAHAAWALERDVWPVLWRSGSLGLACFAFYARLTRALAALAWARGEGRKSYRVLRDIEALSWALSHTDYPGASAASATIRASLAGIHGDRARACRELAAAYQGYASQQMASYAAAVKCRLAELVGGEEERKQYEASASQLHERGVVHLEMLTRMLAPDCRPVRR